MVTGPVLDDNRIDPPSNIWEKTVTVYKLFQSVLAYTV